MEEPEGGVAISRRDRHRAAVVGAIKEAAWAQIAEDGAAKLSLRALAAAIGVSPAGLYRYYDSRDALLTALITDGYSALADALEARAAEPAGTRGDRLLALSATYRRWALEHPRVFALLYGERVPGYAAPDPGPTTAAVWRVGAVFLGVLAEAWHDGHLLAPPGAGPSPAALELSSATMVLGPGRPIPGPVLAVGMAIYGRLHGLVCLEVFGHLDWMGPDSGPLLRTALAADLVQVGLPVSDGAPRERR